MAAMFTAVIIACLGLAQQSEAAGFDTPGWSVTPGEYTLPLSTLGSLTTGDQDTGFGIQPRSLGSLFTNFVPDPRGLGIVDYIIIYNFMDSGDLFGSTNGGFFGPGDAAFTGVESVTNDFLRGMVDNLNNNSPFDLGVWSLGPIGDYGVHSSIIYTVEVVDADGDGCPDDADPYPNSLSVEEVPFIYVGNVAVDNADVDDCTTLADLIDDVLSRDFGAEEMVVYLQEWRDAGYITGREMGQIIKENNTN